jgi:hypothetical protein
MSSASNCSRNCRINAFCFAVSTARQGEARRTNSNESWEIGNAKKNFVPQHEDLIDRENMREHCQEPRDHIEIRMEFDLHQMVREHWLVVRKQMPFARQPQHARVRVCACVIHL